MFENEFTFYTWGINFLNSGIQFDKFISLIVDEVESLCYRRIYMKDPTYSLIHSDFERSSPATVRRNPTYIRGYMEVLWTYLFKISLKMVSVSSTIPVYIRPADMGSTTGY